MKILITSILLLITFGCFGQTYETSKVIQKADSILRIEAGEKLYHYFKYDPSTYYEYSVRNKIKWKALNKTAKTKGQFIKSNVRFNFKHPEYDWIFGYASIRFDSLLNLSYSVNLNFIPKFLQEGKPNNFISKEQAIQIAKDTVLKEKVKELKAELSFNSRVNRYVWLVTNYLSSRTDAIGQVYGEADYVNIDPVTGKVVEQNFNSSYGPLHLIQNKNR